MDQGINFCPHCGHNLKALGPLQDRGWLVSQSAAYYGDREIRLTSAEVTVLHTLMAASGRAVSAETLGIRVGESEDPKSVARIMVHRLRKKIGSLCPVETVSRRGYRWNPPAPVEIEKKVSLAELVS